MKQKQYPREIEEKYKAIEEKAKESNKWVHPDIMRDLLASFAYNRGLYKTFKRAREEMSNFVFEQEG